MASPPEFVTISDWAELTAPSARLGNTRVDAETLTAGELLFGEDVEDAPPPPQPERAAHTRAEKINKDQSQR